MSEGLASFRRSWLVWLPVALLLGVGLLRLSWGAIVEMRLNRALAELRDANRLQPPDLGDPNLPPEQNACPLIEQAGRVMNPGPSPWFAPFDMIDYSPYPAVWYLLVERLKADNQQTLDLLRQARDRPGLDVGPPIDPLVRLRSSRQSPDILDGQDLVRILHDLALLLAMRDRPLEALDLLADVQRLADAAGQYGYESDHFISLGMEAWLSRALFIILATLPDESLLNPQLVSKTEALITRHTQGPSAGERYLIVSTNQLQLQLEDADPIRCIDWMFSSVGRSYHAVSARATQGMARAIEGVDDFPTIDSRLTPLATAVPEENWLSRRRNVPDAYAPMYTLGFAHDRGPACGRCFARRSSGVCSRWRWRRGGITRRTGAGRRTRRRWCRSFWRASRSTRSPTPARQSGSCCMLTPPTPTPRLDRWSTTTKARSTQDRLLSRISVTDRSTTRRARPATSQAGSIATSASTPSSAAPSGSSRRSVSRRSGTSQTT